jgi:WhiB family redox-sensing transcriptional regulator
MPEVQQRRCSTPFAVTPGRWVQRAACRGSGFGPFFPKDGASGPAKAVCAGCVVRAECLAYAMTDPQLQGVWGGTSEADRRLLRQHAA